MITRRLGQFLRAVLRRVLREDIQMLSRLQTHLQGVDHRLTVLEQRLRIRPHLSKAWATGPSRVLERFDYFGFEEVFHDEAVVRERQKLYVPFFLGKEPVLDVGCGRGEFLELLREHRVEGSGVDSNPDMIAQCQKRGLSNVELGDFQDCLRRLPDDHLGGIFCAQVIEHLDLEQLNAFFKLGYRKLRPGGVLVAETINPHCLHAFKLFHVDPTHKAPLFPEFVEFLGRSSGFTKITTWYLWGNELVPDRYHECEDYAVICEKS